MLAQAYRTCAVIVVVSLVSSAAAGDFASYHIGNSLTWDSKPVAIAEMTQGKGMAHTLGYHIRCGSSLPEIWGDNVHCVDPTTHGLFRDALGAYEWDAVTVQPFQDSSLAEDRQIVNDMVDIAREHPANSDLRVLVYAGWPGRAVEDGNFPAAWARAVAPEPDSVMIRARAYYQHLTDMLRTDHAEDMVDVDMIPVGDVMVEIDAKLRRGALTIADYTDATDLFRDSVHLNKVGRYVAGLTTWSVLLRQNPAGLSCPDAYKNGEGGDALTPELIADLQGIVWDVVRNDPYTGVPEPASMALMGLGGLAMLRRRRR